MLKILPKWKGKYKRKSYNGNDELTYKEMETIKVYHGEVWKCDDKTCDQYANRDISQLKPANTLYDANFLSHIFLFLIVGIFPVGWQ